MATTDGRVEGPLHYHQLRAVRWAPYSVPFTIVDGDLVVDSAGVSDMDAEWVSHDDVDEEAAPDHIGATWSCYCGLTFDDGDAGIGHLDEIAEIEKRVLVRLVDEHGPEYADVAKENASNWRAIGPIQGAHEEDLDVTVDNVDEIADRYAEALEQRSPHVLEAAREQLQEADGAD